MTMLHNAHVLWEFFPWTPLVSDIKKNESFEIDEKSTESHCVHFEDKYDDERWPRRRCTTVMNRAIAVQFSLHSVFTNQLKSSRSNKWIIEGLRTVMVNFIVYARNSKMKTSYSREGYSDGHCHWSYRATKTGRRGVFFLLSLLLLLLFCYHLLDI